jgi:hypothetical protein
MIHKFFVGLRPKAPKSASTELVNQPLKPLITHGKLKVVVIDGHQSRVQKRCPGGDDEELYRRMLVVLARA